MADHHSIFPELMENVKQMGGIIRGEYEPSRVSEHHPSVAICTMDATGRIRFGGSEGYVQAMITAIAERYCEGLAGEE